MSTQLYGHLTIVRSLSFFLHNYKFLIIKSLYDPSPNSTILSNFLLPKSSNIYIILYILSDELITKDLKKF